MVAPSRQTSVTATAPVGATPLVGGGVQFRVWAPHAGRVELCVLSPAERRTPMRKAAGGVWETTLPEAGAGWRYAYRIDDEGPFPDPASRRQPLGVHGPSEVFDVTAHRWRDADWTGLRMRGQVLYECHVGTATAAGTFDALALQLPRLARLGVTAIELMPVAAFPGERNWGYDGVCWFAPSENYGGPAALQRFVDAAHSLGVGVLLDVVYNHLGPDGNYLAQFCRHYFNKRRATPWGPSMNLDGRHSAPVRRFIIDNACQWLRDYHVDGLRLDATEWLMDASTPHLLQTLSTASRASVAPKRDVLLIAETHENDPRYFRRAADGGHGFDAVWVDDFYWSLRRFGTGETAGRLQDYSGSLHAVADTINQGFFYEGQHSAFCGTPRGNRAREAAAWHFQYALQHHDHIGNRAQGDRLHHVTGLEWYRVASAVLLLQPATPLIFMGEEFAASSPFLYFTDHHERLGRAVARGRRREFASDPEFDASLRLPSPQSAATFARCVLPLDESARSPGSDIESLYHALIGLRRGDEVLRQQQRSRCRARVLGASLLVLHWQQSEGARLLLANFGARLHVDLATVEAPATGWQIVFATNEKRFGGDGRQCVVDEDGAMVPEHAAIFLQAGP